MNRSGYFSRINLILNAFVFSFMHISESGNEKYTKKEKKRMYRKEK